MKQIAAFILVAMLWGFLLSESIACPNEEPPPEEYDYYLIYLA